MGRRRRGAAHGVPSRALVRLPDQSPVTNGWFRMPPVIGQSVGAIEGLPADNARSRGAVPRSSVRHPVLAADGAGGVPASVSATLRVEHLEEAW